MSRLIAFLSFCYVVGIAGYTWLAYNPVDRSHLAWLHQAGERAIKVVSQGDGVEIDGPSTGHAFNASHRTNQPAIDIIKSYEGLSLDAYLEGDYYLIGYGHKGDDVTAHMTITQEKAEAYLRDDLKVTEQVIRSSVKVPLNENEFSALSILTYNIGSGAFWNSTVLRLLNEDDRQGAADAILMWNKISRDGELQISEILSERRAAERDLFLASIDESTGF